MRISDWSSDVCSSDLRTDHHAAIANVPLPIVATIPLLRGVGIARLAIFLPDALRDYINTAAGAPDDLTFEFPVPALAPQLPSVIRSEEHTSELKSLMRISYAVFCLN